MANFLRSSPILILLICSLGLYAQAETTDEQIADLAREICEDPKQSQDGLTSVQTMLKLINYVEDTLPAKDGCRTRYLSSFRFMQFVLTVGNENVCSDEKVSLLEDFNRRYISTTHRDKQSQKEDELDAPEALKVFFMNYSFKISSICKESLSKVMEQSPVLFLGEEGKPVDLSMVDKVVRGFRENLGLNSGENGYKDLILPWKMIDSFHIPEAGRKYLRDVMVDDGVSRTKIPVRMSIRINGADKLKIIQQSCINNLKPEYSKLALPILRLINLGLYDESEPMAKQMGENKNFDLLFGITQFCETILPIEGFQDDSLEKGKVVAITAHKAAELRAAEPTIQSTLAEQVDYSAVPAAQSMIGDDEIETLSNPEEAKRMATMISSNRADQEGVIKRVANITKSLLRINIETKFGHYMELVSPTNKDLVTKIEIESADQPVARREKRIALALFVGGLVALLILLMFPKFLGAIVWAVSEALFMLCWGVFKLFGKDLYEMEGGFGYW